MESLLYYPLIEVEDKVPSLEWEKQTIEYVINNKNKIIRLIRGFSKFISNINSMDIEDIYSELIEYLYKSDDYDITTALTVSNSKILSLECYISLCVKNCVKRYISRKYKIEKNLTSTVIIDDEGKERDILDTVEDSRCAEEYENICYNINKCIQDCEHIRYRYNIDIFLIIYVRFLTMGMGDDMYRNILEVLGVSKRDLTDILKKCMKDDEIIPMIKSLSLHSTEDVIDCLEKVVHGAKKIREYVECIKCI